ncbi:DUF6710 family protein [Duffyella gerundensis]|uniref:DUF6710 family protein n=1 Tax=Duffyella gerundensis TaxID=1619313 RepID=UPI0027BAD385|nr:DUF6710 family protein [Duffyella gerundensis]
MVELWLPWRIAFVKGGNHSLAAGILSGEGLLLPERVFNMQDLLNRVSTNGLTMAGQLRRSATGVQLRFTSWEGWLADRQLAPVSRHVEAGYKSFHFICHLWAG